MRNFLQRLLADLKSGDWLNRRRILAYAGILLGFNTMPGSTSTFNNLVGPVSGLAQITLVP
jgi:hypothetical protein